MWKQNRRFIAWAGAPAAGFGAALLSVALLATPVMAQGGPDSENGRYALADKGDEVLRLDTRTGTVSVCARKTAGWSCAVVPDERTAFDTEIGRLQRDNDRLKREIAELRQGRKSGDPAAKNSDKGSEQDLTLRLPSEAEINQAMTFLERVWRKLVELVHTLQNEPQAPSKN